MITLDLNHAFLKEDVKAYQDPSLEVCTMNV